MIANLSGHDNFDATPAEAAGTSWSAQRERELRAYLREYVRTRNGPLLPGEAPLAIRLTKALLYLNERITRKAGTRRAGRG